jgi:hypothetical protein
MPRTLDSKATAWINPIYYHAAQGAKASTSPVTDILANKILQVQIGPNVQK